jgi:hypothetical protein
MPMCGARMVDGRVDAILDSTFGLNKSDPAKASLLLPLLSYRDRNLDMVFLATRNGRAQLCVDDYPKWISIETDFRFRFGLANAATNITAVASVKLALPDFLAEKISGSCSVPDAQVNNRLNL